MARHGQQTFTEPIILAIELASMCGSIALVAQDACIAEFTLHSGQTHSKRLLPQIERTIVESGLSWPQISAIAVSLGPGSFTGLRIALSTVKGLAMAFSLPVIGIPTLDGLACQIQHVSSLVCPMIDARKSEVYTALYRCNPQGRPEKISKEMVTSPERLLRYITKKTIFVGDGATLYGDFFRKEIPDLACFTSPLLHFTRASAIGLLALDKFHQHDFLDPVHAAPRYVRASDAEIQRNNKQ